MHNLDIKHYALAICVMQGFKNSLQYIPRYLQIFPKLLLKRDSLRISHL
jgi:hypothetical protein